MGKVYEAIDDRLRDFILAQPVFFVATAPSGGTGHVNVSPKGLRGCLAILSPHRVAYIDYGGSGAETAAHLRDNGRVTVMVCAFDGPPKVVRLHGRGRAVYRTDPECARLLANFDDPAPGLRSVVDIDVTRVSDSCGYGVPLMSYVGDRDLLPRYWERRSDAEIAAYHTQRNAASVDGLPVWGR